MQSPQSDWDAAFHFLSNDFFDQDMLNVASDIAAIQIPTPPVSKEGTPVDISDTIVSVSTIFYPGATHSEAPPDLILLSHDSVFFYVHSDRILDASLNGFNSLLPVRLGSAPVDGTHSIVVLPETAEVLNVILHTIYTISCSHFSPSLDCITQSVDALRKYGISPKSYIAPNMPLYSLILSRAPLYPIELYALASENDLMDLAVAISSHLLSYNLSNLTDKLAVAIGPIYLKRLFFLHLGRNDALKRLLLSPPALHGPTSDCDFIQQKKLTRAWALATAYLAWDARPDLSTSTIESALGSLQEHLTCGLCQQTLKSRVRQLVIEWSNVKRTV
jgi:hypothetical protein